MGREISVQVKMQGKLELCRFNSSEDLCTRVQEEEIKENARDETIISRPS